MAYQLNGNNYLKWSQLVRTFLKGKGKLSHLLGKGPSKDDPKFVAWDEQDSMVMSWLWNSMLLKISNTCIFLGSSKKIWDAIQQTYSKVHDAAKSMRSRQKFQQPSKELELSLNIQVSCKAYGRRWTIINAFKCTALRML